MTVCMAGDAVGGATAVAGAVAGDGCVSRRHAAFTVAIASELRTAVGRAVCVTSGWTRHQAVSILLLLFHGWLKVAVSLLEDRLVDERAVAMDLDPSTVDLHPRNSSQRLRYDCLRLINWLINRATIVDEPRIRRLRQLIEPILHLDRTSIHNRQITTILQHFSMIDNILCRLHDRLLASDKERERFRIRSDPWVVDGKLRIVEFNSARGIGSNGALAHVDICRPPHTPSCFRIWIIPALGLVELRVQSKHERLSTTVHHFLDVATLSVLVHGEKHQSHVCLEIQRQIAMEWSSVDRRWSIRKRISWVDSGVNHFGLIVQCSHRCLGVLLCLEATVPC